MTSASAGSATACPSTRNNYEGESLVNRNCHRFPVADCADDLSQTGWGIKGKEEVSITIWCVVSDASTGINPAIQPAHQRLHHRQSPTTACPAAATPKRSTVPAPAQPYNDEFLGGVSSDQFGTLTFGRQRALGTNAMLAYDPANGSYDFSYIGYNGTMAGGGDTEDTRWDDATKYRIAYGPVHFGAMYKFADGSGGCYSATAGWTAATCTAGTGA